MPIARIDSSKNLSFMQQEGPVFNDLPRIVIGFNGQIYPYLDSSKHIDVFLHFVNRVTDPVLTLSSNS